MEARLNWDCDETLVMTGAQLSFGINLIIIQNSNLAYIVLMENQPHPSVKRPLDTDHQEESQHEESGDSDQSDKHDQPDAGEGKLDLRISDSVQFHELPTDAPWVKELGIMPSFLNPNWKGMPNSNA